MRCLDRRKTMLDPKNQKIKHGPTCSKKSCLWSRARVVMVILIVIFIGFIILILSFPNSCLQLRVPGEVKDLYVKRIAPGGGAAPAPALRSRCARKTGTP